MRSKVLQTARNTVGHASGKSVPYCRAQLPLDVAIERFAATGCETAALGNSLLLRQVGLHYGLV
jgi:hypothetical protein